MLKKWGVLNTLMYGTLLCKQEAYEKFQKQSFLNVPILHTKLSYLMK